MTLHFGVLIPSTNTTVETELSRLPPGYQAHYGRLYTSTPGHPFAPSRDEDIDYQSKDRKSTRLNSSHIPLSRMPSSA
mgnify:CR=1 FL=1